MANVNPAQSGLRTEDSLIAWVLLVYKPLNKPKRLFLARVCDTKTRVCGIVMHTMTILALDVIVVQSSR